MASIDEEIIIIDDAVAIQDAHASSEEKAKTSSNLNKKKIYVISAIIFALLLLVILITIFSSSSEPIEPVNMDFLDEKLQATAPIKIEPTKLENMIAKANYLYENGSKEKALSLYKNIAQYSEAISEYNLGVAQLKNKQYQMALNTFSKAIQNDEKRCVSAINAAVCSLHLNDKVSFKYYIDLAYAYLPYEVDSPLYSYYYTLISYYNEEYLNAMNSLKNPTSKEYPGVQKNLTSIINALFGNDYESIESMEKYSEDGDDFSLGLLYARVGDLNLATSHLEDSIKKNIEPIKAQLALALINIKAGNTTVAASQLKNVTDMYPDEVYTYYPIHVKLKESLFDTQKAQLLYRSEIKDSKSTTYQKIFAFSPYKVFNADKTISYIRKGNANIYIDNIASAQEYLKTSSSSSSVNIGIANAIKKALSLRIREANLDLQNLIKIQPKHSILHYNLALTYAQLGDSQKAYEHFLRSYHLDAKNYLSGVYAVMTGQLINQDSSKLKSILSDAIGDEEASEEKTLYQTLLNISQNNYLSAVDWLNHDYKQRPLYLVLNVLISLKLNKQDLAQSAVAKLVSLLPNDILPHIMYIDANFENLKPKEYANKVLNYFKEQTFHFNDLYYGPNITRYLYIQENLIIGRLFYLREQLKDVLESTSENSNEIESALALANLFDKRFEESYTLYNHLIDELKVQDAETLFLGAVASTAAEHHENAIALLELAKLKNGDYYESRYALALLYLEAKNNEGASIQLAKIKTQGYESYYFDFDINTDELLFKKRNP